MLGLRFNSLWEVQSTECIFFQNQDRLGCDGLLPEFKMLSKMSVKSPVTSVLWDEHSSLGRGTDLCARDACSVSLLPFQVGQIH